MNRSRSCRQNPRFFHRSLAIRFLAAAAIGFATACTQSDPEGGVPKAETWYGLAQNTCGMADGPAIAYILDSVSYSGCINNHDSDQELRVEGKLVDGLRPGEIIRDTVPGCETEFCVNGTVITLEILSTDTAMVTAAFRIESQKDNVRKTLHSGKAILTKCRERPMCG
ncbi:MAG: hypothetical protein ABIW76_06590 [Fibrobacteria bacterium]